MDKVTYTNAKVVDLAGKFIPVKLDAGTNAGGKVFEKYNGQGTPTILFLTPKGKEISRYLGYIAPDDFTKHMKSALAKAKK